MNNFGLPQQAIDKLISYFDTKSEISLVKIFGSRAKGNYRNGSDIDFAIWSDNQETFFKISSELDELPLPYKFDVVNVNTIQHEGMKRSIERDGIVFYQRKSN